MKKQCGIKLGAANAVLVKVNQIGTVTESLNAIEMAKSAGYHTAVSYTHLDVYKRQDHSRI